MLSISGVSKTYAKSTVKAVDRLSLEVKAGEIFGFLGPNGAGKSTTIKIVTGILLADEGEVTVNGIRMSQDKLGVKRCIGYVPDNHAVYDKLTGMEYINFMGSMYDVPVATLKERASELLEKFNLQKAVNDQIKTYSHGMKQKISVIGALVSNPKLWILDEPLTGLDPQSAFELKAMMRKHADAGNTVFFSSHVIDVVERVCDRVAIIGEGRLTRVGTIDELTNGGAKSLETMFLEATAKRG